ncbi:MAG: hypothetical protein ACTHJX_09945 [Terriglobales bacterium]
MKSSRMLIAAAFVATGSLMAWAASPVATAPSATATISATAAPQRGQMMSPADRAKAQVARIDKAVGPLTDDQKTKMESIYEKAYTDSAEAMKSGDREKVRSINEQATKDAQALCTPDQVAKWPAARGRRGGGGVR